MASLSSLGFPAPDGDDTTRFAADMKALRDSIDKWLNANVVPEFADTGWINTGILTAAAGFTLVSQTGRIIGDRAWLRAVYTTNNGITFTPSGDIVNVAVLNIIDQRFAPAVSWGLGGYGNGRLSTHFVIGSVINLAAIGGTNDIAVNSSLSLTGDYLLD